MGYKTGVFLAISMLVSASTYAGCGHVTISELNWNSASLTANIDRFILQHAYGCDAELIPGDAMSVGTSMIEKGEPDIAPEFWLNAMKATIDQGIKDKRITLAGKSLVDGGEEGFWIPKYMVDKYPELKTIAGIRKHPELFPHPEDAHKGAFYSCPAGWNCQISSDNLFKAFHLGKAGFEIVDPGSSAGLSGSIAKAYERHQAWLGYYWAPSAVLGKYKMVKVDFGTGVHLKEFLNCTTKLDCESPKPTMYPPSLVGTLTTEKFAEHDPQVMNYLHKRGFTNKQMNSLLAWMEDNQANGEDTMYYFLKHYPAIWHPWLSKDNIAKIDAAL